MPFYPELRVDKVWPIVKSDVDLIKYFPKYSQKHLPSRDYLYTILSSVHPAETKELLQNALRNRSVYKDRIDDEFIKVSKEWVEELVDVIEIPSISKIVVLFSNKRESFSIVKDKNKSS